MTDEPKRRPRVVDRPAEWDERMRQAEPTAAWARRWNVLPGRLGNHSGVATYSGYAGYVRKGWIPILDRLAEDLIALGWDRTLDQVKQKFGGLRFYTGSRVAIDIHSRDKLQTIDLYTDKGASDDAIAHRIAEAEKESFETCEECGAAGRPRRPRRDDDRGWVETLCPQCFAAEDAELRAQRAEEERNAAAHDDEWQASEKEDARADPAYRSYLEQYVYPVELEERRGRPLRPAEIALAHASCRCGVCRRDLSGETWTAETSATWQREGRCPRCGPIEESSP